MDLKITKEEKTLQERRFYIMFRVVEAICMIFVTMAWILINILEFIADTIKGK